MESKITVAIVDDQQLFKKVLRDALVYDIGFEVVFTCSNGAELVYELERKSVDVVLLDINMPVMSGTDSLQLVKERFPKVKIIILSANDNQSFMMNHYKYGANAILSKGCCIDELIDAINSVAKFGFYLNNQYPIEHSELLRAIPIQAIPKLERSLTDREIVILKLICKEKCTKEISQELALSERTVENHRYRISKKVGVSNSVGLLVYALQNGYVKINAEGLVESD